MMKSRAVSKRNGWALAEVLCSVVIVSLLAAFIAESSAAMARMSASGLDVRMRILDFRSVAREAEFAYTSGALSRGSWQVIVDTRESERGIGAAEISASPERGEASDTIRWIAWDIAGRAR